MKGVLRARGVRGDIIDLTHEVHPQQVRQGAFLLWSAYRHFPKGTIFICVVDPDVGTDRRILAARSGGFVFLAPENGLLDFVLREERRAECVAVSDEAMRRYAAPEISSTFHGRDVFAPLGAALAAGRTLTHLGKRIVPGPSRFGLIMSPGEAIAPAILHIDRFGNIVTNVRSVEGVTRERCSIRIRGTWVRTWSRTYGSMPDRTTCLLAGSSGLVEVAVKDGSAARQLNAELNSQTEVHWK